MNISPSTVGRRPRFAGIGRGFIPVSEIKYFFILYRIDIEVTPMNPLYFSDENRTKFYVNRTIFNEASEKLYKLSFHRISFIMLRIMSFLVLVSSAKHTESIGVVFAKI